MLWFILLPVCLILSWYYPRFRFLLLLLCLGLVLIRVDYGATVIIDEAMLTQDTVITGVVTSLPKRYPNHVRFLFKITALQTADGIVYETPMIARLSWYKTQQTPVPGEVWEFKTRLKRPYGFMNPGGFDYEKWILRQGIRVTGYVKDNPHNRRISVSSAYPIQRLRYHISQNMNQLVPSSLLGFALALSLGERSQLTQRQNEVLRKTGTAHLVAISGLHLSFLAGLAFLLSRFVASRFYFISKWFSTPAFASVIAFIAAFFYAALAGFSLPTQRALIMIGVALGGFLCGRRVKIFNVILLAAVLVLLLDPLAISAADFWLSFMAIIFIFYITFFRVSTHAKLPQSKVAANPLYVSRVSTYAKLTEWWRVQVIKLIQWGRVQVILSLALCPLLAFWFMQMPLYSVLANFIVVPLVGFVMVPLLLLALLLLVPFPDMAVILYKVIAKINDLYWSYLEFIAQQNNSVLPIAMPNIISLILAIIGVFILLLPKGLPARWLGIFFLLPLFFPIIDKPEVNEFDFTLLDVGQGLAAVIKTKNHVLVYDTGARFSDRFNIGEAVLKPYLKYNGIKTISILLLSHGDNDHIGGAESLIDYFNIDQIISSVSKKFHNRSVTQNCYAGKNWEWDGVQFEILHPEVKTSFTGNNASCVLKVSGPYGSVLLTGDIEKQAEYSLLHRVADKLKADLLIVPHHGSKSSSTLEFIRQVEPKYAFFPAGYRNRFGLPKQDIISRYQLLGIDTRISYQTGAISVRFGKAARKIEEFRQRNQ